MGRGGGKRGNCSARLSSSSGKGEVARSATSSAPKSPDQPIFPRSIRLSSGSTVCLVEIPSNLHSLILNSSRVSNIFSCIQSVDISPPPFFRAFCDFCHFATATRNQRVIRIESDNSVQLPIYKYMQMRGDCTINKVSHSNKVKQRLSTGMIFIVLAK